MTDLILMPFVACPTLYNVHYNVRYKVHSEPKMEYEMFKETVAATKFRDKLRSYLDMVTETGDAIQIIHKGEKEPIRVLITQEHYLNLLSQIDVLKASHSSFEESAENIKTVKRFSRIDLIKNKERLDKKLKLEHEIHGEVVEDK